MVQRHLPWLHPRTSPKAARQRRRSTTPPTPKLQVRVGLGLSSRRAALGGRLPRRAPGWRGARAAHPSPLPAADEVEAKTQEVSVCLEDIMEKLRSAFPSSRGTRAKSPSLASYCSLR